MPCSSDRRRPSGHWTEAEDALLRNLAEQGRSAQQIADQIGRTRGGVNSRAQRFQIPIRSPLSPWARLWSDVEDTALKNLAKQGATIQQAVDQIGRSYGSIEGRSRKLGVKLSRPDWSNHVTINPTAQAVLDGVLLSDGSLLLTGSKKSASLSVEQSPKREGWLEQIRNALSETGIVSRLTPYTRRPKKKLEGRTLPGGVYLTLRSLSYAELVAERDRWYRSGTKLVPRDLRLTPLLVAHWLCGDGYGGDRRGRLGFCTDGFSKACVDFLIERLQVDLGVRACRSRRRPGQYHVSLNRMAEAHRLANLIRPYLPDCCLYKIQHTKPRPENPRRRLTPEQVRQVRTRCQEGHTNTSTARLFGVSYSVIDCVVKGSTYKDVT